MLELKGPGENLMNNERIHRGFSTKVKKAVDQVRNYERFIGRKENIDKMIEQFGYLPEEPRHAVLIGRDPEDSI
jgi:hypothetical protein